MGMHNTVSSVGFALMYVLHSNSWLSSVLVQYPDIQQLLLNAGTCAVCGQPVINSWLECVHFQSAKTVRH